MTNQEQKEKLQKALLKCAVGYTAVDEIMEYVHDKYDDKMLTKTKMTYREIPPQLAAIKMLLEESNGGSHDLTEEQLQKEKVRLLKLLDSICKEKDEQKP